MLMNRIGMRAARPAAGFTLIELVIVVAIVAILAAVGVPSFLDQVRKARRADAIEALTDLANRQERYYSTNFRYADDLAKLGYATQSGATSTPSPDGHYTISLNTAADGNTFTVTAQPVSNGSQAADTQCQRFSLDQSGTRGALGEAPADGSDKTPPDTVQTCWRQ